jgi:sulfide:quinone oxidoreductase
MWMAWDRFKRTNRANIQVDFYTGMPTMFSVKKYSDALDALRSERGVGGYFGHDLVSIDVGSRRATFKKTSDGSTVDVPYSFLHVTPPMGPLDLFKGSPIADANGWIPVHNGTMQHVKPECSNVFALGDCSSLPTSKTAAAITAQAPILAENLFSLIDTGKVTGAEYDGYTSCPVSRLFSDFSSLNLTPFSCLLDTESLCLQNSSMG